MDCFPGPPGGGNGKCYNHNIALLRMESPIIDNGETITAIPMDTGVARELHECMITGWGALSGLYLNFNLRDIMYKFTIILKT